MNTINYDVINLDTDDCEGTFEDLAQARLHARQLRAYEIWSVIRRCGSWEMVRRVEFCDPYDGDDARIRQACGEAPWDQAS